MNKQELHQQKFAKSICEQFEREERPNLSRLIGVFIALAVASTAINVGASALSKMEKNVS